MGHETTQRFPKTEAAIAATSGAYNPNDPTGRLYEAVREAYGAELLKTITGDLYRPSDFHFAELIKHTAAQALFDHGTVFQRPGSGVAPCWTDCIAIGQPYNVLRKDGSVDAKALEVAIALNAEGVAVWARSDLSAWKPGATQLVVAGLALRTKTAAEFGFECIGAPWPGGRLRVHNLQVVR